MTVVVTTEADLRRIVREETQRVLEEAAAVRAPAVVHAPALLTTEEVAQRCATTPTTVRAWIHSGRLAANRAGRRFLVKVADLERFLAGPSEHLQPDPDSHFTTLLKRIAKARTP